MAQLELIRECQARVKRNNSFNKDKWLGAIGIKTESNPHLKEMILNYFVSEGYETAAESFAKEASLKLGERNSEIIRIKDKIRTALQSRDIEQVKVELNTFSPALLKENTELLLHLDLIKFRNLVHLGQFEEALDFIRDITEDYLEQNKHVALIEEHLLLLALKDPSKGPSAHLLEESRILDLNTQINKELNERKEAEIIVMMKLMKWMEKRLNTSLKVPRLTNMSQLKFSLN